MSQVQLKAYCNTDDAFLVWKADMLDGCLGFAIERSWVETSTPARQRNRPEYLVNRVGFENDAKAGPNQRRPSNVWPFQRYNWTDHELGFGDVARYRVVPMVGTPGALSAKVEWASDWVEVRAVQPENGRLSCFFNRPMATSPWMARITAEHNIKNSTALVKEVAKVDSSYLRDFCGGTLIYALRNLFDYADSNQTVELYAALFELEDAEIIQRFCALGERAHIVLSNGSAKASEPDANAIGRKLAHHAGCEVVDRMTSVPGNVGDLGHNKFIIIVENKTPVRVWTGSTNRTSTGLFTQINNALLVENGELALHYLEQWKRLVAAKSEAPSTLKKTNAAPGLGANIPAVIRPWFTPTVKQADLRKLQAVVEQAKDGILFLSFMPGPKGPILDILEERAAGIYVRGVVNQFVGGVNGKLVAELVDGNEADPMNLDAINPSGIKQQFAFWAHEFTKGGKISVLIHSKVMCIDLFGDNPVVVTGSHNFSSLASESNDENFLVVEGDKAMSVSYATHIISVYNHYRWRQYVASTLASTKEPWQKLDDKATWQLSRIKSHKQKDEWKFWLPTK